MTGEAASQLLDMRVSVLLARSPEALPRLVAYGFTPLENPLLRRTLAPTVTLAQAIRLRGLSAEAAENLLGELLELASCR